MLRLLSALAFAFLPAAVQAQDVNQLRGTISGLECTVQNCELLVDFGSAGWLVAVCPASTCEPWNEARALPDDLLGANVRVVLGAGKRYQADGIPVPALAFTMVEIEP